MSPTQTAARKGRRERLDGPLVTLGVTKDNHIAWTLDHSSLRWTPEKAVRAAKNRIRNSPDGLTLLDGLWVTESDVDSLIGYLDEHELLANIARCGECAGPCNAADRLCGGCIHEITEGDE